MINSIYNLGSNILQKKLYIKKNWLSRFQKKKKFLSQVSTSFMYINSVKDYQSLRTITELENLKEHPMIICE